jgi:MYXO-CTERM domain-containing protein
MKSFALLGATALITSSASATVTGLSVEMTYHAASNRDVYSVFVNSNGPNASGMHDVMLNMIAHNVLTGNMSGVRHTDSFVDDSSQPVGHWNASYTSAATGSASNLWKDSFVTITGKTGASASTSLDPSFGSGVFNSASPNIPANAGWYTANPAVDILITGGKIKVMQFALVHGDAGWTGKVSVGYKLQGTTTALYAMNLTYSVGVPAPGALALLGLAGLVSRRRRG